MKNYSKKYKSSCGKNKGRCCLIFAICVSLLLIVCGLSCRSKKPAETDVNEVEPNKVAVETEPKAVAATVDGVDITEERVEALIKPELDRVSAKTAQLPPAFAQQYKNQLRQQTVERLINEQLLGEQVNKAQIEISEQEVTEYLRSRISEQSPSLSLEEFKTRIEAQGRSFDEMRRRIRDGLAYQKLMEAQWAGKINITEEDVKKYYSENQKEFEKPEQIRASHILIKPDPNTDPNQAKAQAKAKAEDLLKQIKEGADFAELAKANSACPSAAKGGDLDFFARGDMVQAFEKAAFQLQLGQISDTVETKYGYHIIKVTDHKDASAIPFEQAKDGIITKLTRNKQSEIAKEYILSLREKANIVYPPGKEPQVNMPTPPGSATGQ